jgi:predicted aldo/keto reductase-like oxidoreductase
MTFPKSDANKKGVIIFVGFCCHQTVGKVETSVPRCMIRFARWHMYFQQGCHIFLCTKYQKGEKYTKFPQTIPNVHKI